MLAGYVVLPMRAVFRKICYLRAGEEFHASVSSSFAMMKAAHGTSVFLSFRQTASEWQRPSISSLVSSIWSQKHG